MSLVPMFYVNKNRNGRPFHTNYEDMSYILLKNGRSYNVLCLICNSRLKNIARKRLLDHRQICGSNKKRKRTSKSAIQLKRGYSDEKEAYGSEDKSNSVNIGISFEPSGFFYKSHIVQSLNI